MRLRIRSLSSAMTWSAVLHVAVLAFFMLALLSCSGIETLFGWLHLPASWNPIVCPQPLSLPGPVIETTLVGPTGSPPPRPSHAKAKPQSQSSPPAPKPAQPQPQPEPSKLKPQPKPLPAPPKHPDVKDQERVVEDALEKAEHVKHVQEEKQRQRQAELDAEAAKKKKQAALDKLFAQMDAAQAKTKQAAKDSQTAEQKLKELEKSTDDAVANVARAAHKQSGTNGQDKGLLAQYLAAVQNAVTQNWLRPDNMPNQPCIVHIVQLPGGQVMSAQADPSCPYDAVGRQSVENAVLRAQPLPYQGFESVFQRNLTFTFRPQ